MKASNYSQTWKKFPVLFFIAGFIFLGFNVPKVEAADITVEAATVITTSRSMRSMVWASPLVGYFFFIDGDDDFFYIKTTNGGASWANPVEIDTDTTIIATAFDVWFDQWTPGDSGTKIHIWWFEASLDDVRYVSLDTNGDTLGTQSTVFDAATVAPGRGTFISGTKTRGGNLYTAFDVDAGVEKGLRRSTDSGATWTTRYTTGTTDTVIEATLDEAMLFPGNEVDTNDLWILYHDADANQLTLKMHDDSANTTSESASILTFAEEGTSGTGQHGFEGSIRHSDGHLIAATISEYDTTTADFQVWDINGTASITEKTAIATNIDDIYYPNVFIDQGSDDIYVAYIGKRDGTEVLSTTVGVYYTKSTDDGATWSAGDTTYSATASDWRQTWVAPSGPRFAVGWRDLSSQALMTNYDNSWVRTTTLGDGTDGGNSTIAPSASATYLDAFTLQSNSGSTTVTALTVTLDVANSFNNIATVEIKDDSGVTDQCTDITNPASVTLNFTGCSLAVTTSSTQFRVYITPKAHADMPAVPGASYATTATVTSITSTNVTAGTDTDSATITVDNASPAGVTSSTATAGNTVVNLAWTNPVDADFTTSGTVVVLRRATSAVADVPVEGTTYTVGNTIGTATVACVVTGSPPAETCQDTSLSNGTAYHYKIFTQDSRGNYNAGTVPTGSPATPVVTTLGDGTDGANSTIAPSASATEIDRFSLVTSSGTDSVSGLTVTLAGDASAYTNIATVDVQTTGGVSQCSSSSWGSDNIVELTCSSVSTIDSYSESNQDSSDWFTSGATGVTNIGQTFLLSPGSDVTVGSAKFYLSKTGSPTGTSTATIYATSGTCGVDATATGAVLATSDTFDVTTLTGSYALTTFTFSGAQQATLTAGSCYYVGVSSPTVSTGNTVNVGRDDTSPSHSGNYAFNGSSGGWLSSSSYDAPFYLYDTGSAGIPVTTTPTDYVVKITPKTHDNMPAVPGASYATTATVTSITATNSTAGTDTDSATITVDNESPANATVTSASAGDTQVTVSYTPHDSPSGADVHSVVVLRSTSAVADVPVEGTIYTGGETIGGATVATGCVDTSVTNNIADSCTATGLTNGVAYHFKIFTKDSKGNYDAGVVPTGSPVTPVGATTTLGDGTDGANSTIAPSASATEIDRFSLVTSAGTDTVTGLTVTLAGNASAYTNIALVTIQTTGGLTKCTGIPGSNTVVVNSYYALNCDISVTTTPTEYIVKITPKAHANMPAVPGASYATTATVTSITATNTTAGTDTDSATITVDNASPAGVTSSTATGGNTVVDLAWTNPADADFTTSGTTVVLRSTSAVADTPIEGVTYTVGNFASAGVADSYSEVNQDSGASFSSWIDSVGQTFTGDGNKLASVKFYLKKTGSPPKDSWGYAKLYAVSGTPGTNAVPTGAVLATSDPFDITTLTTSYQLVTLNFSGNNVVTLGNGTDYIIVFDIGAWSPTDYVTIAIDTSSPSDAGNYVEYANDGGGWVSSAAKDTIFYVYTLSAGSTVACVVTGSPPAETCQDTSLSNGTAYHYKIFTQDSRGNYDAGTVPTGSPATPVASVGLTQYGYRWRKDNANESSATYIVDENIPLTSGVYVGDNRRLRISISNTGADTATNMAYRLEYSSGVCAAWSQVPNSGDNSGPLVMTSSTHVTNAEATTDEAELSNPSGKTFVAGYVMTTASEGGLHTLTNAQFTELEYSIETTSNVVADTTYCFRVTNAGSATGFTYSYTPELRPSALVFRSRGGGGGDVEAAAATPDPAQTQGSGGGASGSGSESSGTPDAPASGGAGGGNVPADGDSGYLPGKNNLAAVVASNAEIAKLVRFVLSPWWW